MSFINIHNVLAPFTNKVHLTTIILVALAFAAIRWHGGGVEIEESADKRVRTPKRATAPATTTETRAKPKRTNFEMFEKAPVKTKKTREVIDLPRGNTDFVDSMIESTAKKRAASKNRAAAKKPTKEGGLDDVERILGLD